ncbi:pyruvate-formate lyase-activating enzyme [Paenibacillus sp. FA6]|uniref:pyruvate-formate lyase-activating enzyme n=1 Tax=Paenibacillus sp. FA6 TaxID=3413029 RepID=UPI003F65AE9B
MSVLVGKLQYEDLPPDERELVDFINKYDRRPLSDFYGKYHHIKFEWRPLLDNKKQLFDDMLNVLEVVSWEERREFVAQVIRCVALPDDALEQLFEAAFGE